MEKVAIALKEFWYIIQGDGKRFCAAFSSKVQFAVSNMIYCVDDVSTNLFNTNDYIYIS